MQVQNEKELIQIPIDIFYDEFTVYESNERVTYEKFSENKRYIIEYQEGVLEILCQSDRIYSKGLNNESNT